MRLATLTRGAQAALVTCLLIFSACAAASYIDINVQAYSDPEIEIAAGSSFATVPLGAMGNDLLERELLGLVRQRLEARGYRYDEQAPAYVVGVSGFMGSKDEYIPPSTIYLPIPGSETQTGTFTGTAGNVPVRGTVTSAGQPSYVPLTTPARSVSLYTRIIDVAVAQIVVDDGKSTTRAAWSGHAQSTGRTGDLLVVAPSLLDELFGEFPRRTGQGPDRRRPWR